MTAIVHEMRIAARALLRRSALPISLGIILMMACAVSATAVITTFIEAVLLRPLPFRAPHRLVDVQLVQKGERSTASFGEAVPFDLVRRWQERIRVFEGIGAYSVDYRTLRDGSRPRTQTVIGITENLFPLLGSVPTLGRTIRLEDEAPAAEPVVLLSDMFWARHYGRSRDILGQRLVLNETNFTIIGVMPEGFRLPNSIPESEKHEPEIWVPVGLMAADDASLPMAVLGYLRAGVPIRFAEEQLDRDLHALSGPGAAQTGAAAQVARVQLVQSLMGARVRGALLMLLIAVAILVLVASVNIVMLVLAAALSRRRAMAVRLALGAQPPRLVSQFVVELGLLAIVGGTVGLLLAAAAVPTLLVMLDSYLPDVGVISLNWRVVAATAGVLCLIVLGAGGVGAWQGLRRLSPSALSDGSASTGLGARTRRLNSWMVGGEFAAALVLLSVLGTLLMSFRRLTTSERGYDPQDVVVASMTMTGQRYSDRGNRLAFAERIRSEVASVPGVRGAAISSTAPLSGGLRGKAIATGRRIMPPDTIAVQVVAASPGYFSVLGQAVVRGRSWAAEGAQDGVVVDEEAARRLFGGADPTRRTVDLPMFSLNAAVVGVVRTAEEILPRSATTGFRRVAAPHVFIPLEAGLGRTVSVVARATQPGPGTRETISRILADADPSLELPSVRLMSQMLADRFARERFLAFVSAAIGVLATLIAVGGLFAVTSQATAEQAREYALRIALGAQPRHVLILSLRRGVALCLCGGVAGVVLAAAAGGLLRSLLFEVGPAEPAILGSSALLLIGAGVLAAYLPSRRAMSSDPATVLRAE